MSVLGNFVFGFALVFSFVSGAAAQNLYGEWSGTVDQTGPGKDQRGRYQARMVLNGTQGQMDYPSLGCGGSLTFQNRNGDTSFYIEHIAYGRDKCIDGGRVAVQPSGNSVHWAWNGSFATASGVLTSSMASAHAQASQDGRTAYEPVWTRNARLAEELRVQAEELTKTADRKSKEHLLDRGPLFEAWQKLTEAVQLSPDDPFLLRDFCHSSFEVGRYRDVVWCARKLNEDKVNGWIMMSAAVQAEWGISLAVLGDYEGAARVIQKGLAKFPNEDVTKNWLPSWEDYFREWSIILTYLNKDFHAATEEARAHPVQALGGSVLNGSALNGGVWDLLKNHIWNLAGMAETHKMQYPLLSHLSQLHRLIRDGLEGSGGGGYLSFETPEWKAKVGEIGHDIAWRTISIYRSLPIKPLPPPGAVEKAKRALTVIATAPNQVSWYEAIRDLIDVTRRVPWWAEAHCNVAVLLEDSHSGNWSYYGWAPNYYVSTNNRNIAAQEYMFCIGADPQGAEAGAARKMLKKWKQPIPYE